MNQEQSLFDEYNRLLVSQKFIASDLDYTIVEKHRIFLEKLDAISNSATSIFDLYKQDHIYISKKYAQLYGWDMERIDKEGTAYTNGFFHPEDLPQQLQAGIYFLKMGFEAPVAERKNFKLITEYRLKNANGNYIRVLEQHMLLETDIHGNIWLALSIIDPSPESDPDAPFRCRAIDTVTGNLFHFPPDELKTQTDLSKREIEILKLIWKGLISKQIADQLFISVNTVNTHRQRIIEKLGVSNTAEALHYAHGIGLI
jgi:DNA-binding CsgD family transcriptional regulator